MHTGSAEIVDRIRAVLADAEHKNETAGEILAEERTCLAADYHNREVLLVGLHVDAGAVAAVALDIDLAAAHRVAAGVADVAVHNDLTGVHGVADGLLRVAEDLNGGAVQILAETVACRAVHGDLAVGGAAADVALADHVFNRDLAVLRCADLLVYLFIIGKSCLYSCHFRAPPVLIRLRA